LKGVIEQSEAARSAAFEPVAPDVQRRRQRAAYWLPLEFQTGESQRIKRGNPTARKQARLLAEAEVRNLFRG